LTRSPRAVRWEKTLPWAVVSISQAAAADDRGRGFVCAKAVDKNSSRDAGTSVTARIPNACARCAAGKRPSVRRNGVSTKRSKPSTPPPNVRTAGVPPLRPNHPRLLKLRRRVVTQQEFFYRGRCASGRGVTNRPPSRAATRQPTAAAPAARRFTVSWIANASGGSVARSRAAAPASANTRPLAHAAAANPLTWTARRHPSHCRRNRDPGRAGPPSLAWHHTPPNVGPRVRFVSPQESQA